MKRLKCEICGSTEIIKDGGIFICQTCGCKYTVEEARKMMDEGAVDTRDTVRIDNSEFVRRSLDNARRAKEREDWEEAERYYNMVEQHIPECIEAVFYSAYAKAMASLIDEDIYKRKAIFNVLKNCISYVNDGYETRTTEENEVIIRSMSKDLLGMFKSHFVYTTWRNGYGTAIKENKSDTYELFMNVIYKFRDTIVKLEKKHPEPYMYETLIEFIQRCMNLTFEGQNNYNIKKIYGPWLSQQKEELSEIRKVRYESYWNLHEDEKKNLENERSSLMDELEVVESQICKIEERNRPNIEELAKKMDVKIEEELLFEKQQQLVHDLETQYHKLGLFKGNEKRTILDRLNSVEKPKLEELRNKASNAKKEYLLLIGKQIEAIQDEGMELRNRSIEISTRITQIGEEFTKNR